MRRFYILIIDLIGSSKLAERDSATRSLENAIRTINKDFSAYFFAPLEITRGDEVAAVLYSVNSVYTILLEFIEALSPVDLRAGLVYGELTAGLESGSSRVMDGPAFYLADKMMRALKKTQKTFASNTGEKTDDIPLEALFNLILWRWKEMTPLQRKIVQLYQEKRNQSEVGQIIGRTQQQVSQTLSASKWELMATAESAIHLLLNQIDNKNKTSIV